MRLESYKDISPSHEMMDLIVKIMVEVITILSLATTEIKQGRSSESIDVRKLRLTYFLQKKL